MSIFGTRSCQLRVSLSLVMLGGLLCTVPARADDDLNLYVLEGGLNQVQVVQTGDNGFPTAVTATIPVGKIATSAKASPDQRSVWVNNGGDGTITIIKTADNSTRLISTAAAGEVACIPNNFPTPCSIPGKFVFHPNGKQVFLSDLGDNSVKVIDTGTGNILKSISVGHFPAGLAITPDGSTLYVPNLLDNTVSVISTSSETVLTTITMPGSTFHGSLPASCVGTGASLSPPSPTNIAVTPAGDFAFVTNAYDLGLVPACAPFEPSTVSVIRTADNTVINANSPISTGGFLASSIHFLRGPHPIALVANTGTDAFPDNRIGVIDSVQLSLISVTTEPSPSVGPTQIAPLGHLTYVSNAGNGAGESIVTLNNTTFAVVNTFTLPSGGFPSSIAIVHSGD